MCTTSAGPRPTTPTLYDLLPNQADGGTCDAAPSQFTAQVFEADGTTAVSPVLAEGSDYTVTFLGDPDCSLAINMLTRQSPRLARDQRLIVSYQATLDTDSQQGASLTNIAGATEWFSIDVSDAAALNYARTYTRTITDGTVATLDHEDAHTVGRVHADTGVRQVRNQCHHGEDPATVATPGDTIRYGLRVENLSDTPLDGFSIVDEIDRLNATPMFQAGTLTITTLPPVRPTTAMLHGGAAGTGLLDISDLSLARLGDSVLIEFEVLLLPAIANGSYVLNQSEATFAGLPLRSVTTRTRTGRPIRTSPVTKIRPRFISSRRLHLISTRCRVTSKAIRTYCSPAKRCATRSPCRTSVPTMPPASTLVDQVPGNTSYVAGSTTLNGVAVADAANGNSPLSDGIAIYAPQDTTAGNMNAAVADNIATIVFDVLVYPDLPDGTILSNQAFVTAVDQGIGDVPSDDPRTPVVDDPTQDVVGNYPLLFAPKTAELVVDGSSPGIVDPGDVLRYTITVYNNGAVPATAVELSDDVPVDTTYVADSVTLNGAAGLSA